MFLSSRKLKLLISIFFSTLLVSCAAKYSKSSYKELAQNSQNYESINLNNLWINFMQKGEYNQPHSHGGDLSFVIYASMPNELVEENKNFLGTGAGPGSISFFYGEKVATAMVVDAARAATRR